AEGLSWAPVHRSATGAPRVPAEWVADHLDAVTVVDVREPDEWGGETGRIAGAALAPLATLPDALDALERDRPLVLVCRSGGRSDRAACVLEERGFSRVASLTGGMLRWNDLGLPVELGDPPARGPGPR